MSKLGSMMCGKMFQLCQCGFVRPWPAVIAPIWDDKLSFQGKVTGMLSLAIRLHVILILQPDIGVVPPSRIHTHDQLCGCAHTANLNRRHWWNLTYLPQPSGTAVILGQLHNQQC
jgi:hypothetical protein